MKKLFMRTMSIILTVLVLVSCLTLATVSVSAATYRSGAQSGPSSSYKNGRYYSNYTRVPITGDNRTDLLAIALSQLGYQEGAANGAFSGEVSGRYNYVEYSYNMGDLGLGYGGSDYPWCASFVSWCLYQSRCTDQGTYKSLGRYHSGDYDYIWKEISCSQWVRQLKGAGYFKYSNYMGGSYTPKYGDLVYFQNSGGVAHIGICLYTSGGRIYTIEGNTSDASGLEANGGGVYFKNYALTSSYLYGYGVLPYVSNSSVPKIDYSGTNPTPGLYVANAGKYVYTTETGSTYNYVLPRFSMFEVTEVCSNGRLKGKFTINGSTVTGYVKNNSDRVIQLSSTATDAVDTAKVDLKAVVDKVKNIRHTNYTETTILQIRDAYSNAVSLLSSSTATAAQVKSAKTNLENLMALTGSNTIAQNNAGIYINGRDEVIAAGDCHLFSPDFNGGLITASNANIRYTLNVVVKWDATQSVNVIKSKSYGSGSSTPDIQLEADEFLIACHDWETGISSADNPVAGSGTNYKLLESMEIGTPVKLSGVSALSYMTSVEPAAYIKFMDPQGVVMNGKNTTLTHGQAILYTTDYEGGVITPANANTHLTCNVLVEWDDSKGYWTVKDKFAGNGDTSDTANTVTLTEGQALIAAHDWQTGVTDDTLVYGSAANYAKLAAAEVGQKVVFSGISPDASVDALSCSANISFKTVANNEESSDETVTYENIALGKPQTLTPSKDIASGNIKYAEDLTDGKAINEVSLNGGWFGFFNITTSQYNSCNTTDGIGSVIIDLQGKYSIDQVKAHFLAGSAADVYGIGAPAAASVSVSLDGNTYAHAGYLTIDPDANEAFWAELSSAKAVGRYIKLDVGCSPSWTFINEIEVYGAEYTEPEDNNVALGKSYVGSAFADSEYRANLTDGIAADTFVYGTNNADWFGFINTGSASTGNAPDGKGIITIDLGGVCEITGISTNVQAGVNDANAVQFEYINSYYSIDGSWYDYIGTFNPDNTKSAPFWHSKTLDTPLYARYIKFNYKVYDDVLSLVNEIKVYGTQMTTAKAAEVGDMSTVSLTGDFTKWNPTPNMTVVNNHVVSTTMELEAGTYAFKVLYGNTWYGNNGTMYNTTTTTSDIGWEMNTSDGNCTFVATGGTYKFDFDTNDMRLYVDYTPAASLPEGNNIAIGKNYSANILPESNYGTSLTDDIVSDTFQYGVNNSSWFAFANTGDEATGNTTDNKGLVTVDLGGLCEVTGVSAYVFAGENDAGAVQPSSINAYYSMDGVEYSYLKELKPDTDASTPYWLAKTLDVPVNARYIKFAYFVAEGDMILTNEVQVYGTQLTVDDAEPGSMSSIVLTGDFNEWTTEPNMVNVDGTMVSAQVELESGEYEFKIIAGSTWYGNTGVIEDTTVETAEDGWLMAGGADNCTLNAITGGTYTFKFNTRTNRLIVIAGADDSNGDDETPDTPVEEVYYLRGTFNDWGTSDVMTKNADGTYSITLAFEAGDYEFKIANEDYSKSYPDSNMALNVPRKAEVTFTLNTEDGTIGVTQFVTEYNVVFVDKDGVVLDEQVVKAGEAAVAPTAPQVEGMKFTGWDKNFSKVTEDMTIKAMYMSATGLFKTEISGGTRFTVSINGGAARPQGTYYKNTKMPVGATVTVTAFSSEGNTFIGWLNESDAIICTDLTYTLTTTGNDYLKALYVTSVEGVNLVTFKNAKAAGGNGQIIDMQYYAAGDEIVVPDAPTQAGYVFTGWDMTAEEIAAAIANGEDVTVSAVWEVKKVYVAVNVTNGAVTANGGEENGKYLANRAVTVTADAAPSSKKFAYWTNENGSIKSYDAEYKFYPATDTTLIAVYVAEDEEIVYQALADIAADPSVDGEKISYTLSWNVPASVGTYKSSGLMVVNKADFNADTFYHGTTDTKVFDRALSGTALKPQNTYSINKSSSYYDNTYVAATWVQYEVNGELVTIYSDFIEVTKLG